MKTLGKEEFDALITEHPSYKDRTYSSEPLLEGEPNRYLISFEETDEQFILDLNEGEENPQKEQELESSLAFV